MIHVGFVLLTHDRPDQIRRLVRTLDILYDSPQIVWHHDSGQCDLGQLADSPCLELVEPHIPTSWGSFGIVSATLEALRRATERPNPPDWIVLLSGADYPLKTGDQVTAELANLDCSMCMEAREIRPGIVDGEWGSECVERYFGFEVPIPRLAPHGFRISPSPVRMPLLLRLLSPYSKSFRCFAGSQWFCVKTGTAVRMLDWHRRNPWLAQHLEYRWCPDETFFQTIAANLDSLQIHWENFRYTRWGPGSVRPKTLETDDLAAALESGAHFARKFSPDSPALDALDRRLGVQPFKS